MSLLVFSETEYRQEEEKEGSLQGCHVCVVRTEVRGQTALRAFWLIKLIHPFAGDFPGLGQGEFLLYAAILVGKENLKGGKPSERSMNVVEKGVVRGGQ